MIDIANAFVKEYDEVTLIAGKIEKMERELDARIKVDKIISYRKKNAFGRFYTWVQGTIQIFFKLLIKYRRTDILFVTNPPMAYLIAKIIKNPYSILVYDTYPDALKNIGITEKNIFYKIWSNLNKNIFSNARKIFTLSDGMANNLSLYVSKNLITVIPNWSGSEKIRPIPRKENIFLQNNLFKDDFIVLYSGNMGYTHSIEVIIEVAILLKNEKNVHFLLIGEGKKKTELMKTVDAHSLTNCSFLSWQDADIMPYSLASANLGVVTLNQETAHLSVPSKTYNLLAAGVPLLSVSPEESELSSLIEKYGNGRNFSASQIKEIRDFILYCRDHDDILKQMSEQSLAASKNYTYKNALLYVEC